MLSLYCSETLIFNVNIFRSNFFKTSFPFYCKGGEKCKGWGISNALLLYVPNLSIREILFIFKFLLTHL